MQVSIFFDIVIIIIFAALLANIVRFFKQPLILGYVIAGLLIGPSFFSFIKNPEYLSTFSEIGIAFLLFIVGMELDFKRLKEVSNVVIITGILQSLLTMIVGFFVASLWFDITQSIYFGLIVSFSSTMVVIKLISDKGQLDTLHGRIVLGILLIQDIIAVIVLPLLPTLNKFSYSLLSIALLKGIGLIVFAFLMSKYVFYSVLKATAKMPELLFVTALAICFIFASFAAILGFSIAIGAFIAGVALASFPYNLEIIGRIKSLKDFFIIIFFVTLGSQLSLSDFNFNILLIIALLATVLLLKPIIIFVILKFFRYGNNTSFFSGAYLAQVSEFSLIIATLGQSLGHITKETFTLVILISVFTITLTSYFINYDKELYRLFSNFLIPFERYSSKELRKLPKEISAHTILMGAHRMGLNIIKTLKQKNENFIVVDFNPEVIRKLIKMNVNCIYGDISNIDVLMHLNLKKAKMVISTVPNTMDNMFLIEMIRKEHKNCIVIVRSSSAFEALNLYKKGADFVVLPELLAGQKISDYLTHLKDKEIKKWGKTYKDNLAKSLYYEDGIW